MSKPDAPTVKVPATVTRFAPGLNLPLTAKAALVRMALLKKTEVPLLMVSRLNINVPLRDCVIPPKATLAALLVVV